jgi:hypothetical protein
MSSTPEYKRGAPKIEPQIASDRLFGINMNIRYEKKDKKNKKMKIEYKKELRLSNKV